jgi:hypothetical protein
MNTNVGLLAVVLTIVGCAQRPRVESIDPIEVATVSTCTANAEQFARYLNPNRLNIRGNRCR